MRFLHPVILLPGKVEIQISDLFNPVSDLLNSVSGPKYLTSDPIYPVSGLKYPVSDLITPITRLKSRIRPAYQVMYHVIHEASVIGALFMLTVCFVHNHVIAAISSVIDQ